MDENPRPISCMGDFSGHRMLVDCVHARIGVPLDADFPNSMIVRIRQLRWYPSNYTFLNGDKFCEGKDTFAINSQGKLLAVKLGCFGAADHDMARDWFFLCRFEIIPAPETSKPCLLDSFRMTGRIC